MVAKPVHRKIGIEIFAEAMRNPSIGQLVARNDAEATAALISLLKRAAARGEIDASLDMSSLRPGLPPWSTVPSDGQRSIPISTRPIRARPRAKS